MARGDVVNAIPSRTVTAGGSQNGFQTAEGASQVVLHCNVTAISGTTPVFTPLVKWSNDGVTFLDADPLDSTSGFTATGTKAKNFAVKGKYFVVVWGLSGTTPSCTFSVNTYTY